MNNTHVAASPRALKKIGLIFATLLTAAFLIAPAVPANAAGTPSGPQYDYRMVSVSKTGSRVKSEGISSITCQSSGTGTATYSTSSTLSNTFSVTGGLSFSGLASLLGGSVSVSGGVTSSTTITQGLSYNLTAPQCVKVYALRDKFSYTLQKKCNYACTGAYASKTWVTQGTGTYTKFVGRAYYLV